MKWKIFIISNILLFNILAIIPSAKENGKDLYRDNCKRDLLVLMMAYPDEIKDIEENDTAKRQAIQRPVFCSL